MTKSIKALVCGCVMTALWPAWVRACDIAIDPPLVISQLMGRPALLLNRDERGLLDRYLRDEQRLMFLSSIGCRPNSDTPTAEQLREMRQIEERWWGSDNSQNKK